MAQALELSPHFRFDVGPEDTDPTREFVRRKVPDELSTVSRISTQAINISDQFDEHCNKFEFLTVSFHNAGANN